MVTARQPLKTADQIKNADQNVACEVCGEIEAHENLGICVPCFQRWLKGQIELTNDQKQRIRARMGAVLGDGGEVHMEQLGCEDEATEARAQALYQQR